MLDQEIGNYRITRTLGEGGMGVVYAAEHKLLGRPAAIKVLLPQYLNNQQIVDRFFNEAKAATEIKHPGIVEIYDFGYRDDGSAYIAMELLEGEDLEARLRRLGQLPIGQAIQFSIQIASALAVAHQRGVIHRDLKPANVFIVPDPQVVGGERIKLLDFGIAKVSMSDGADAESLTRAGMVMGTPSYMAPEQCLGAASVDARADLYSVGCIMFEMVCGHPPFRGPSSMDVMKLQMRAAPPRPSELRAEVGAELEGVILYLLNKEPAQRYHSASELEAALKRLVPASSPSLTSVTSLSGRGVDGGKRSRWRRLVILAVAAIAVIAGGAVLGMMKKRAQSAQSARSDDSGAQVANAAGKDGAAEPAPPPVNKKETEAPLVFCAGNAGACEYPLDEPVVTWRIESRPARAMVRYKGKNQGETPLVIKVARDPERTETVLLRLYNHADEKVELSAAEDSTEMVEMAPYVKITIDSSPRGAVIYNPQTGEGLGETPGEVGVPPGDEPMRLLLRKPGYQDRDIEFVPDKDRKEKVKLTALVTMTIESEPAGAEVWQDGARLGETPYQAQVPRGRDELVYEIKRDGFEVARVKLKPSRDRKERVTLKPL